MIIRLPERQLKMYLNVAFFIFWMCKYNQQYNEFTISTLYGDMCSRLFPASPKVQLLREMIIIYLGLNKKCNHMFTIQTTCPCS